MKLNSTPVATVVPVSGASEFHPRKVEANDGTTSNKVAKVATEQKYLRLLKILYHQRDMRPID